MKNSAVKRSAFKLGPVAAGCAVLVLATSGAYAQDLGTVTVTGIRKGIEDAISVKKNSDSIVESISAEDIGKLPDNSVAESIARLPGVTAQRNRETGRAQDVSIRGMPGSFGTALLNGREQATTSFGRGVEFDQYPSELMSGVTVYKTPDVRLSGQGLSGTIDLQTVSPLNFSKRQINAGLRTEKTGVGLDSTGTGTRSNFSYIDQFADRTIGLAIGFARFENKTGGQNIGDFGWGGGDATVRRADGTTFRAPVDNNGWNEFTSTYDQKREGVAAILEFKPNKDFTSKVDMLYSKFDTKEIRIGAGGPLNDEWGDRSPWDRAGFLTNATLDASGRVVSGTWNEVRMSSRNSPAETKAELQSIGWANKFKFGDAITAFADLGTSKAKSDFKRIETEASTVGPVPATGPTNLTNVSFTNYGKTITGTSVNFADPNIIKVGAFQNWGSDFDRYPQDAYINNPLVDETVNTARLGARYDLGDASAFSAVDLGVNFSDRKKEKKNLEYIGTLKTKTATPGGVVTSPFAMVNAPSPSVGYAGASRIPVLVWDVLGSANSLYNYQQVAGANQAQKSYGVTEKVTTMYGKLDLDTAVAGFPLRGNVGVQVINTDQSSTAAAVDNSAAGQVKPQSLVTSGTTYTDVLPAANLIFDVGSGQSLRLSVAKQMARPDMDQMRAVRDLGYDNTKQIYSASGGNPKLEPYRANAFDVSYEKYFGTKAYIGAAAFYKDIQTYVLNATLKNYDFTQEVAALRAAGSTIVNAPNKLGDLNTVINGAGGTIRGVELTANLPLSLLSKELDGFGFIATTSNTSSSLTPPNKAGGSGATMELPGLSKQVSSLTAYYEKDGFSARVARRQRSAFVGNYQNVYAEIAASYIGAESITDLQFGYEFQSGAMKGLSVVLQANNLTDQEFRQYEYRADGSEKDTFNFKYGKTYLFGLNYKF